MFHPRLFFLIFASRQKKSSILFFNSTHPIQRPFSGFPGEAYICAPVLFHAPSSSPCMQFSAHGMQRQSFFLSAPATLSPPATTSRQSPQLPAGAQWSNTSNHQDVKKKNAVSESIGIKKQRKVSQPLPRGRRHEWPTPGSPRVLPKPLEACDRALFYPSTREIGSCVSFIPEL